MRFSEVKEDVLQELHVQRKVQSLNVPGVMGPPGIGKTALAEEVAIEMDTTLYVSNVGDSGDPTDETGTPVPAGMLENRVLIVPEAMQSEAIEEYVRQSMTRDDAGDRVERIIWALNKGAYMACTSPVMLLKDDFDKASDLIMKALIGLFGTRSFRDYKLHPLSLLMCAGNRVGDDLLSSEISQSVLGRVTILELEAYFEDFEKFALENPKEIDLDILGFLKANSDLLYVPPKEGAYASPSPRSWHQTSQHFTHLGPEPPKKADILTWKNQRTRTIERKCGTGIKNTWVVWQNILSRIDVPLLLSQGYLAKPAADDERAFKYATVFALSRYIHNNRPKKEWTGFPTFLSSLEGEFKLALLVQLPRHRTSDLVRLFPGTGTELIGSLVEDDEEEEDD